MALVLTNGGWCAPAGWRPCLHVNYSSCFQEPLANGTASDTCMDQAVCYMNLMLGGSRKRSFRNHLQGRLCLARA